MEKFKTIKQNSIAEIIEKKSKFIANTFYAETIEDAEKILKNIRKKYYDARHNCYAYRIIENNNIIDKCSDDGEPSGTAGSPMLNILQKNKLCNILVVVTRYFGGILLGTGGLVRCYSDATIKSIENNEIINIENGFEWQIEIEYKDLDMAKYYFMKNNINIIDIKYLENIILVIEITEKDKEKIFNNNVELKFNIIKNKILSQKYIQKGINN